MLFRSTQEQEQKQIESENESPNNESPKREVNMSSKDIANDIINDITNDIANDNANDNTNDNNDKPDNDNKDEEVEKNMESIDVKCITKEKDESINNNNSICTKEITQYLIKMLQIISKVHEAGVVHRDIKPENFMIGFSEPGKEDSEKTLNIIDFGL